MKLLRHLAFFSILLWAARAQTVSVTSSASTYSTSGGSMTFTVVLTYPASCTSVAFSVENAPQGWTYSQTGGSNVPAVVPAAGYPGPFEFAYANIPASPATFTFTLNYPAGLSGNQIMGGLTGLFRGVPNSSGPTQLLAASLVLGPGSGGDPGSVATAPTITQAPVGATVLAGDSHTFSVTATGTAPLSYQWSRNNTAVAGATSSTLVLSKVSGAVAGSYTVVVSNAAGSTTSAAVLLTVQEGTTTVPQIVTGPASATVAQGGSVTLSVTASGGAPLNYQWSKAGTVLAGSTSDRLALIGVQLGTAGSYTVTVSNAAGSVTSAPAVITVVPTATAPVITTQPTSASVAPGATVTLRVEASGTAPLTYQWRKDGVNLAGATNATLGLENVTAGMGGSYSVVVSNSAGSVASGAAAVTVSAGASQAPTITVQPGGQTAAPGATVTLAVVATGSAPLAYQWRKDGAALTGRTAASLVLTNVTAATAGSYSVVVSNAIGTVTSNAAVLTVQAGTAGGVAGTYVGSFDGNAGSFALLVRADRTGTFVGYSPSTRAAVISRSVVLDAAGRFSVEEPTASLEHRASAGSPAMAAQEGVFRIDGAVAADGTLSGSVPLLNLRFSAPAAIVSGATAGVAGFYLSGAAGSSAVSYAIMSPVGDAVVVTVSGSAADGGKGTIDVSGSIAVTTAARARITGNVRADASVTTTYAPETGAAVVFQGANLALRNETEKLVNISTRSRTGTVTDSLVAGFVISGSTPKPVLVRAIGPTLAGFGVGGALSAARLEVFRGATSLAVGNNWGDGAAANDIVDAAARVGAFPLTRTSRDAALLLELTPGAYTAVVAGQDGAAGVALVEVYDATAGAIPPAQRIINIATRSRAGAGDDALIAGFVIAGSVPKRLLVRGAGPALAQFGVTEVLARPELTVNAATTVLARNTGWSDSPDVAAITVAGSQVGAFAFPVGSADAAIIINLAPGTYTAQLVGAAGSSGNALIEIYELP